MGQSFLIDTNIIINFQTQTIPLAGQQFVADILDDSFIISFISYIEVLGYKYLSEAMEDFVKLAEVIELNPEIINQTIQLRRKYKIKLPDALIAATALTFHLSLVTHNKIDFLNIKGLKVVDPFDVK